MATLNELRQQQKNTLKCEICDKEFKSNNCLKNHFNIVHKLMTELQCNICQKVFKLQAQLTSHVKIVHENKKYHKCGSCKKSFSQAGILKKHINSVHNGQKDHKCVTCGKQFSQAGTLKKHINSVYKVGHLLSELAIEFASELWCQILLSELTNKVSESRCRMWIESRFRQ